MYGRACIQYLQIGVVCLLLLLPFAVSSQDENQFEIENSDGLIVSLERVEFQALTGQREPEHDVFIIIFAALHNPTAENLCLFASDVRLKLNSRTYRPQSGVMRDLKVVGGLLEDFPGAYRGQCVEGNSTKPTFVAFDVPLGLFDVSFLLQDQSLTLPINFPITDTDINSELFNFHFSELEQVPLSYSYVPNALEITLIINSLQAIDIQEDRLSDVITRGDDLLLIYSIYELKENGQSGNVALRVWGPTVDVFDGHEFGNTEFETLTVQIADTSHVGVTFRLIEIDNFEVAVTFAQNVNQLCRQYCENSLVDAVSAFVPFASQVITTVKIGTQTLETGVDIVNFFNTDDVLGDNTSIYEKAALDSKVLSQEFTFRQMTITGWEYYLSYDVMVSD